MPAPVGFVSLFWECHYLSLGIHHSHSPSYQSITPRLVSHLSLCHGCRAGPRDGHTGQSIPSLGYFTQRLWQRSCPFPLSPGVSNQGSHRSLVIPVSPHPAGAMIPSRKLMSGMNCETAQGEATGKDQERPANVTEVPVPRPVSHDPINSLFLLKLLWDGFLSIATQGALALTTSRVKYRRRQRKKQNLDFFQVVYNSWSL